MATKCFVVLQQVTVNEPISAAAAYFTWQILNSDGTSALVPGITYASCIGLTYGSTLASLRVAVQENIASQVGFTPTAYAWLDDKGLL